MYKCAIIGCGNIGSGYDKAIPLRWTLTHAGAYHLCDKTELIAAADTDPEALKNFGEKWKVQKLYADYREMLETELIDILSLCLPAEGHFEAFKFACQKDIQAIFCEKPLSFDLNEAKEMVRMSDGLVIAVNYFRRWNPTILQLKEDIQKGKYGKVKRVTAHYTKGLIGNGSHLIDLMRWFFGEPDEIQVMKYYNSDSKNPGVDFSLSFEGNIKTYFPHVPDVSYVFIDIDILTDKYRVVLGQRGQRLQKFGLKNDPYYPNLDILEIIEDTETNWRNCLLRGVEEIVSCLRYGGQPTCNAVDGLRTVEIFHEILKKLPDEVR